jgi:hypothetical protein
MAAIMVSSLDIYAVLKALRPSIEEHGWDTIIERYRRASRRGPGRPRGSRNKSVQSRQIKQLDVILLTFARFKMEKGRFPEERLYIFDKPGSPRQAIKQAVDRYWPMIEGHSQSKDAVVARLWRRHKKRKSG